MPRNDAVSIQLDGVMGGITCLFPCNKFLEVYTPNSTIQVYSPENLDPQNINPDMQWAYAPVQNIGTTNQIVARLIIELDEFTKMLYSSDNAKTILLHDQFHICKEYLIQCQKISLDIKTQVDNIEAQLLKNPIKNKKVINLPVVSNLENLSNTFLLKSKDYIQSLAEIFNILFKTKCKGPHFHKIRDFLENNFEKNDSLYQLVAKAEHDFLSIIVDWRNRVEHPDPAKFISTYNYTISPQNKILPPQWVLPEGTAYPIAEQMIYIVDGLLSFSECFYMICVQKKCSSFRVEIETIVDENRDPKCPILYRPHIKLFK